MSPFVSKRLPNVGLTSTPHAFLIVSTISPYPLHHPPPPPLRQRTPSLRQRRGFIAQSLWCPHSSPHSHHSHSTTSSHAFLRRVGAFARAGGLRVALRGAAVAGTRTMNDPSLRGAAKWPLVSAT